MKKISVIIPVYNSEKTIEECLDSIVNQTIFVDIELVIVDDCSNDKGPELIMKYEAKYPENILFIKLDKNAGPGNARNVAFEYASGEYIGFVDSDDAVYPMMYEKMYKEAVRTGADYIDCGFYDQKKDEAIVYVSDELSGDLDDRKRSSLIIAGGFIWSKLFRKAFLKEYGICFRNEYVLEDMDFLIECTAKASKIGNVKEILYVYRDSNSSLSKTSEPLKYIHNQTSAMKAIYEKTYKLDNYIGIRDAIEFMILKLYSNVINTCMNIVYTGKQSENEIIPILDSMRKMKDAIISNYEYDSEYIKKGIREVDLAIIRANDVSAQTALALQKKN